MNSHDSGNGKVGKDRGLSMSNLDAQSILKTMRQPFVVLDHDLVVQGANKAFYDTFDVEPDETEGRTIYDLGNGQWDIPKLRELLEDILPNSRIVEDYMVDHQFETIGRRIMMINARQIPERSPALMMLSIDDITKQEDQRQETEQQKHLAEIIIDAAPVSFLVLDKDLKVLRANETFYDAFAVDREETQGHLVYELGNCQWDIPKLRELLEHVLPDNDTFNGFEVEHDFEEIGQSFDTDADGSVSNAELGAGLSVLLAQHDADGNVAHFPDEFATIFAQVMLGMAERPFTMLDVYANGDNSGDAMAFPAKVIARMRLMHVNDAATEAD